MSPPETPFDGEAGAPERRIRVTNLVLGLEESEVQLRAQAAAVLGLAAEQVLGLKVARRSLDARRRGRARELRFVVNADLTLGRGVQSVALERALKSGRARMLAPPAQFELPRIDDTWRSRRVAVVGAGPAGLYAAWTLASNGVGVDLIDRGPGLRERSRAVARFQRTRELDPERNLLFGEGGAGTYSDGKLYTRTQHALEGPIVETLVAAGAPSEIAFDARAHIGTDRLHRILPRLRERLEQMGVRFHFDTRVDGWVIDPVGNRRRVLALRTSGGELACDGVVLAVGHSARDSVRALHEQGLAVEAKPFQIGLRVEHPQELIDRGRLGEEADVEKLGHAYYGLVAKARDGVPAVYSFCMCPGGQIVPAVAQPGYLCTNGMSNSRHSSGFANAGLVVTVGPEEFGAGVFAGVLFQEQIEARFFEIGGADYRVPAQRVPDFVAGRASSDVGRSSYKLGHTAARIDRMLPAGMAQPLREAIERFDRQLPGFNSADGLLVGIESRSSSPLRMPRAADSRLAKGFENVWPVGEGAGYAGGIMSAAIDGARSAWALLGHRESH